jgi:uncharacterized protein YkwD
MPQRRQSSNTARKRRLALHQHAARHLKHWLVPHARNDHRPHLIRAHGLALVALLVLGVQASALAMRPVEHSVTNTGGHPVTGSVLAYATDININDLLNQTNQERAANGLPALHLDQRLDSSAQMKAGNMFSEDYWAHVSPSGIQPWYWFTKAGYPYSYAGENLAKDFDTTAGVMAGWMNSPGHRANILNTHYVDVGFAVENGTLQGSQTTLVVAHYGSIAASTPAPAPAKPTSGPVSPAAANVGPTPAPTPSATAPASPPPASSPLAAPQVKGEITPGTSAPAPVGYSLFKPLSLTRTATAPTLITLGLLLLLLVVYAYTHVTVWRKGLPWGRHPRYHLYAAASVGGLIVAIIWLTTAGFGQVG